MFASQQPVNKETLYLELIHCPYQPGRLRISKNACSLRFLQAQKIPQKIPYTEFDIIRWRGLKVCRTCPEGRQYAAN